MRSITSGNFEILAPNAIAYAFNRMPYTVRRSGAVSITATFIVMHDGVEIGAENREAYSESVTASLQAYSQQIFSNISLTKTATNGSRIVVPSEMMKSISVTISARATMEDNTEESLVTDIPQDVIFGTMGARGSSSNPSKIRLYPNLPQTFDCLASQSSVLTVENAFGGEVIRRISLNATAETISRYRMVNVNPATTGRGYSDVYIAVSPTLEVNGGEIIAPTTSRTMAEVDERDCGVYLRWLDRHGRWQYFLFTESDISYDVKEMQEWEMASVTDPMEYVDGLNDTVNIRRSYERMNTRKLTARLVDDGLRELLLSLTMSVAVDVYDGRNSDGDYLWHRVLIKGGKYSTNFKPRQDFVVEIEEPSDFSQIP